MRKNGNARVFCTQGKDGLNFYLATNSQRFYLFSTSYHSQPIFEEYAGGKPLDYLFRKSRKCRQQNIRSRAIRMLSYVEKEHHLSLFAKTKATSKLKN